MQHDRWKQWIPLAVVGGLVSCSSGDASGPWNRASRIGHAAKALSEYAPDPLPGGTLDPTTVPKYVTPLVIPPAMPRAAKIKNMMGKNADYYEIAVREFSQDILPASMGAPTKVWSYGAVAFPGTVAQGGTFNYPALTIEAKWNSPVRVAWRNELVKDPVDCFYTPGGPISATSCNFLPHILPVDETLHWANPRGECKSGAVKTDCRGVQQASYEGPVPIVTHVHGAHTTEDSDGYPEAWYLPAANDIPGYIHFTSGTFYSDFKAEAEANQGQAWGPGEAVFEYPNDMRATTLWYHDHSLGLTRTNVYAGPAGFFLLRGGPGDLVTDLKGKVATLPGPAPALGDPPGVKYYEIPVVFQGRSFDSDGALFYPDNRDFFEGLNAGDLANLGVHFTPDNNSDVAPIWQPEFFGNTMVVNGKTWPFLDVDARRYRLRLLNGCDARFLILRLVRATNPDDPTTWVQVTGAIAQIGAEGGFLPTPQALDELLMAPAERADVIVDFAVAQAQMLPGEGLYLVNIGPDEPYGGGVPGVDFSKANAQTTGQVMKFNVLPASGPDKTTPIANLVLPARTLLPAVPDNVRQVTLNEEESATETLCVDADENWLPITTRPCPDGVTSSVCVDDMGNYSVVAGSDCSPNTKVDVFEIPFGPTAALLGTLNPDGTGNVLTWSAAITEKAANGAVEEWEIYNFTADAHPIHIHLIQFEVVNRQGLAVDADGVAVQPAVLLPGVRGPEVWETGLKDTVIAYPGEVTRVKARFDTAGIFVWHCHIIEHEDNEMMRPYCVKKPDGTYPASCNKAGVAP